MADITMCLNDECLMRQDCYRYTAKPNEFHQSYANFRSVDGECIAFWPIIKRKP